MSRYEPFDTLKPVGEGIWIIDSAPVAFYGMPFSTRATVVRLADGGLWVHSPTRITEALAEDLAALGEVRHIVAPNWIHYVHIPAWQKRYPGVTSWAAPGVVKRAASKGVRLVFSHELVQEPPADWAGEIDQMIVRGSKLHREAVFFHRASRTLILTDLIENFDPGALGRLHRVLGRFAGVLAPEGQAPLDMRMTFRRGLKKLRADVQRMLDWAPERVILAHGDWYEADGTARLRHAFRWAGV